MSPKLAFISQTRLSTLFNNVRKENHWAVDFQLHEYIAEQNRSKILALDSRRDIEVVIAGGGNASVISAMQLNTPLVVIEISGFDIMQALWQAQQLAKKAVFINYNEPISQLDQFASIFSISVEQHTFSSIQEAFNTVLKTIQQPDSIIIGASHVCDIAESMNANSVFIYSQDAIHKALITAQQLALSLRAEREKREKFEAILRSVTDGIIYIDENLKIEEINPAAELILGINAQDSLMKPISSVFPDSPLVKVIEDKKSQYNQILHFGDTKILSNRIAVFNQGKLIGAVASFQDVKTVRKAERTLRVDSHLKGLIAKNSLDSFIGKNPQIKRLITKAELFAKSDATILIQGDTGTGKELIAQGIHLASKRASGPFVAINCASIPDTLLESTLFGYEEGAFTGAHKDGKTGLFELANKGTIFLDEIGELPVELQGRLLRVLQEKEIMRVGSDSVITLDTRVIAATNRSLIEMMNNNSFKQDLYYRLNVLNLSLPCLKQRISDIPLFIKHFFQIKKIEPTEYSDLINRSLNDFLNYTWPGNIRELENIIERLAIMFKAKLPLIDIEEELKKSLSGSLLTSQQPSSIDKKQPLACDHSVTTAPQSQDIGLNNIHRTYEAQHLQTVLEHCHHNKTLAAKQLGISRSTLWRKLKQHNSRLAD